MVLPNVNVLYNNAFLNLTAEPLVLHIPDTQGRFFIQEILDAWRNLRTLEGVFSEPASAAGIAGLAHAEHEGRVVCIVTGHGLKDPAAVGT